MADELNLLPCPFCESPANLLLDEDDCPYVACASCHISQPAHRPGFEHMAIAAWNRRAAPAAAQLDADSLPLLPRTVTNPDGSTSTYISEYENDLENDLAAIRDLFPTPDFGDLHDLWSEACSDPRAVVAYVKEQIEGIRAQYAERIRLLTEELENWKKSSGLLSESRDRWKASAKRCEQPAQSIGDDPEFMKLEVAYVKAMYAWEDAPSEETGAAIASARKALIAYIDGRTASTAWISVADRLPEAGELVFVYSPPTKYDHPGEVNITFDCIDPDADADEPSWLNHNEHYEHFCCVAKPEGSVGPSADAPYTHWMPLPAAPSPLSGTEEAT